MAAAILRRGRALPISTFFISQRPLIPTPFSPIPDSFLVPNNHSKAHCFHTRPHSQSDGDPFPFPEGSDSLGDVLVEQVVRSDVEGDKSQKLHMFYRGCDCRWVVICSSTIALRFASLPLLAFQFSKMKRIQQLFPQKKRREIGCPSYLWVLATASVQIPCFLLGMTTIRKVSLDLLPGFDCGGTLWFQNITYYSHGVFCFIFPTVIACLHYANVQISFEKASARKITGLLDLLASYYKTYLKILTLSIFVAGFCVPLVSLVYWFTNSSFTVIQQRALKHPSVHLAMGLPESDTRVEGAGSETLQDVPESKLLEQKEQSTVSAYDLSPEDLLKLSVKYLSEHKRKSPRAIPLLSSLEKDPDYVTASITLGQALPQEGLLKDAADCLEQAVSKLLENGHPLEPEKVDLLILASEWTGIALVRQNKKAEGMIHLQRIASIDEPDDPKSKGHYYDGLVLLSSALVDNDQREEAAKHLRKAVLYNPAYQELLDQCEKDDAFVSDLANSRRAD